MRTPAVIARWIMIGGIGIAAAGCSYSADVRNTTNGPVLVRMLQVDPVQPDWVLATERVGPGGWARLGPSSVPFERVVVEVGNQMTNSVPARYTLSPGSTRLDIGQAPKSDPSRDEIIFTLNKRVD